MIIDIKTIGMTEVAAYFQGLPNVVQRILTLKIQQLTLELEARVKQKLSGEVLKVRSGALRRSIQSMVKTMQTVVQGIVYSAGDVKYGAIHEFGGMTEPHIIIPRKAKALAFMSNGKMVFAKLVRHPGSRMPERSFMRSSLREMAARIEAVLSAALGAI